VRLRALAVSRPFGYAICSSGISHVAFMVWSVEILAVPAAYAF
jgi:hypothetical protein